MVKHDPTSSHKKISRPVFEQLDYFDKLFQEPMQKVSLCLGQDDYVLGLLWQDHQVCSNLTQNTVPKLANNNAAKTSRISRNKTSIGFAIVMIMCN
jgi:hypothetical protein